MKQMTEFDRVVKKYENVLDGIEGVVRPLVRAGLLIRDKDLHSLLDGGASLKEQATMIADKETAKYKIPFKKRKEAEEITSEYFQIINEASRSLRKVLCSNSYHPFDVKAFHVQDEKVTLSDEWLQEMKDCFEPKQTEARMQALELMDNAVAAIEALNAFVADNPYLGKGVTSSTDDRRCLIWIDGEGNIHREDNNLKFI